MSIFLLLALCPLLERNDIVDQMPALLKKLSDFGEVLLLGDTNARVGDLNDGKLIFDEHMDEDLETTLFTKQREPNQDKVVNGNGDEIISWARAGSLWVLNGRCLPNSCTYFATQGRSNCDTWLGTEWVLENSFDGKVDGPVLDSDHARISLVLPFLVSRRATDCAQYNFIQSAIQKLKPPWKMRRSNILRVAADPQAMENLRVE